VLYSIARTPSAPWAGRLRLEGRERAVRAEGAPDVRGWCQWRDACDLSGRSKEGRGRSCRSRASNSDQDQLAPSQAIKAHAPRTKSGNAPSAAAARSGRALRPSRCADRAPQPATRPSPPTPPRRQQQVLLSAPAVHAPRERVCRKLGRVLGGVDEGEVRSSGIINLQVASRHV
jgi:hypothetical protein